MNPDGLTPPPGGFPVPPPPPPMPRTGLSVDQQLRINAAHIAAVALGGRDAYNPGDVAVLEVRDAITELAVGIEPYIRDGAVPAATLRTPAPTGAGVCLRCGTWDTQPALHPRCPQCAQPWSGDFREHAVIRSAIRFRVDPSDENRAALFAKVDELLRVGESQEAS